jgi:hypothetical protein
MTRKKTAWQLHLESFRKENPEMSLKEAMIGASKTYQKKE